ncbi:MAG: carboxypeptidase regulatory-like domain-containing protein [Planctomycetota bacterium]|nr:carboxypeptidase regulatory-like domain-containing protein [Planctomycetota bacterium]
MAPITSSKMGAGNPLGRGHCNGTTVPIQRNSAGLQRGDRWAVAFPSPALGTASTIGLESISVIAIAVSSTPAPDLIAVRSIEGFRVVPVVREASREVHRWSGSGRIGDRRLPARRKEIRMSRNTLIALGLVLGLTLLIGGWLRDQWFDSGPLGNPSVAVEARQDSLPLEPSGSELMANRVDPELGPVQISGIISSFEGSVAPLAQVFLYRVQFPDQFYARGGVSLWEVLDWDQLRDSGGSELATLPLRKDLARSLTLFSETLADSRGNYKFRDLERGFYLVAAATEETLLTPSDELIELEDEPIRRDLWLLAGSRLTVRTIDSRGAVEDARVIVRGNLVDPAAGSEAWYFSSEELLLYMLNPPMQAGRTDADGRVQFNRLPQLDYQVYAIKAPLAQASQRMTVSTSREITLELDDGARIDGVVVSTSGVEIEGAMVHLRDPQQGRWAELPRPLPHAVSDAAGRFQLLGIPPGIYQIHSEAPGFVAGRMMGIEPDRDSPLPLVVTMEPGAVIQGIVRNESGDPLEGIEVEARNVKNQLNPEMVLTDEHGEFVIDTVAPGHYLLTFTGTGWKRQHMGIGAGLDRFEVVLTKVPILTGRVIDPKGNPISRARVAMGQGGDPQETTTTDAAGRFRLLLYRNQDMLEILARGYQQWSQQIDPAIGGDLGDVVLAAAEMVEGLVFSPAGQPVSGARITAKQVHQGPRDPTRRDSSSAWSKSDGSFRISLLDPDLQWNLTASFPLLLASEAVLVDPQGHNTFGVKLMLRWGAEVSGTVTGEGVPVAGATVFFRAGGRGWSRNQNNRSIRTDENGQFQVSGLIDGLYSIRASADGFGDVLLADQMIRTDEQLRIDLQLLRESTLSGIVIDERGGPVNGVQVSVGDSTGARRIAVSRLDGYFSIDQLAPGLVQLSAEADGFLRTRLAEVDPRLGPIEIVLNQEHLLMGVVVDLETGDPIARARVNVSVVSSNRRSGPTGRGFSDRSNQQGQFKVRGLRAQRYQVSTTAEGFFTATFPIELPFAIPDETIVIELNSGGRVLVDVVDEAGSMVEGASLRAYLLEEGGAGSSPSNSRGYNRSNRSVASTSTDGTGRGILGGLIDGFYRISIQHDMYLPTQSVAVVKKLHGSTRLRVVLVRGATIRGQVRDSSGTLLHGGRVSARSPGVSRRRVEIDESGNYSISGLAPGLYQVVYESRKMPLDPPPRGEIEVSGTGQRILDLRP